MNLSFTYKICWILTAALFLSWNNAAGQQSLCEGSVTPYSVDIDENGGNGSTGSVYTWQVLEMSFQGTIAVESSSGNQITIDWENTPAGNYTLLVTEENSGCTSSQTLQVSIGTGFNIQLANQYICPNATDPIIFDAGTGYDSYQWIFNNQVIGSGQSIAVFDPGTYNLTVTQGSCSATTSVELEEVVLPILNLNVENNTIIVNSSVATGNLQYQLEDTNGNVLESWQTSNVFNNIPRGKYIIRVKTDEGGCEVTEGINLLVIPNIVTPNGDGINDVWDLSFLRNYNGAVVELYDRYGKRIYTMSPANGYIWNGFYLDSSLPSTTYWYVVTLESGEVIKGFLTVKDRNAKDTW